MRHCHASSALEVLWACNKAEFSFLGHRNSSRPRRTPPSASRGSASSPLSARRDGKCLLLLGMLWCPAPVLGGGRRVCAGACQAGSLLPARARTPLVSYFSNLPTLYQYICVSGTSIIMSVHSGTGPTCDLFSTPHSQCTTSRPSWG